jgi:N-formylglutamate deformylase
LLDEKGSRPFAKDNFCAIYYFMEIRSQETHAYRILAPDAWCSSVIFASPHSGRAYEDGFLAETILDPLTLRSSEDAYVDQLIGDVAPWGCPFICAQAPRAYVDLNRAVDEIDPAVIEGAIKRGSNPRIASGLGVIPRVVAHGRFIYRGKLPLAEAQRRIDKLWRPYHDAMAALIRAGTERFGQAILLDLHSMPHEAVASFSKSHQPAEIVVGDRYGASADPDITQFVVACFQRAGFRVALNAPFAGAYILQTYGKPNRRQHALQIEIDRSLYLDAKTLRPSDGFAQTQTKLRHALREIAQWAQETDQQHPLAAE